MMTKRMATGIPILLALSLSLASVLTGCSSGKKTSTTATIPVDAGANRQRVVIQNALGVQMLRVDLRSDAVTIVSNLSGVSEDHLVSTPAREGVRVYSLGGSKVIEASTDTDGFKLKGPAGETRWQVKVSADKTSVRQGEETEVYSLRPKGAERVDVREGDVDTGRVERSSGSGDIKVKTPDGKVFAVIKSARFSDAYGGLLMSKIPPTERAVLAAELLARTR
jgi:hypothetical protein